MIFKIAVAAILLFLISAVTSHAADNSDLLPEIEAVFDANLAGKTESMLIQAPVGTEDYYFIQTAGENVFGDKEVEIKKRFNLLAKLALISKLQEEDRDLTGVNVRGWIDARFWVDGNLYLLFSYIKAKDVSKSYERNTENQVFGEDSDYIQEQIYKLEVYVDGHPKALKEYEELHRLYMLTGNIDRAYETKSIIMDLKFEL